MKPFIHPCTKLKEGDLVQPEEPGITWDQFFPRPIGVLIGFSKFGSPESEDQTKFFDPNRLMKISSEAVEQDPAFDFDLEEGEKGITHALVRWSSPYILGSLGNLFGMKEEIQSQVLLENYIPLNFLEKYSIKLGENQ
jgi:hypothetical protein